MKNIVFIAPPAAGKGTQAKMICDAYKIPHISTGDLLRASANSNTEKGDVIKKQMALGSLIEDSVVLELLKERILKEDCQDGYVLDGFPRNVKQAKAYDKMLKELGKSLECVIVLDLDYEIAKNRITGRLSCPKCGQVFNDKINTLKPEKEGICDFCKETLIRRKDDNEESFKNRFTMYEKETKPLIDYYRKKDILVHIDSNKDAYLIFKDIRGVLS